MIYSVADWQVPFRTRYLVEAMADNLRASKFLYVERPICLLTTPLRYAGRFKLWMAQHQPRQVRHNLLVYQPYVLLHDHLAPGVPGMVRLNQRILASQLERTVRHLNMHCDSLVTWISDPFQEEYLGLIGEKISIYDCFDGYSVAGGKTILRTSDILEKRERRILSRVDIVMVASESLYEAKVQFHSNVHLVPNAVDARHFGAACDVDTRIPEDVSAIPEPIIGFVGNINCDRIDFRLIAHLARSHPEWSIVFVGKVIDKSSSRALCLSFRQANDYPNVRFLGARSYDTLPSYLKAFDVCIIPYSLDPFNLSCSPLKLYEYLAAGKPVVSTPLPAVLPFRDVVQIGDTYAEFEKEISVALKQNDQASILRRGKVAKEHSWTERIERVVSAL